MSADKGFYYITNNYNLDIIIIKGNKIFDVYIFCENIEITNTIIQQIADLKFYCKNLIYEKIKTAGF